MKTQDYTLNPHTKPTSDFTQCIVLSGSEENKYSHTGSLKLFLHTALFATHCTATIKCKLHPKHYTMQSYVRGKFSVITISL